MPQQNTARIVELVPLTRDHKKMPLRDGHDSWESLCDEIFDLLDPMTDTGPIVVWRGSDGDLQPVRMECERFAPGLRTACGDTISANTHFLSEEEAWRAIIRYTEAGVDMAGRDVMRAERQLSRSQEQAAKAAKEFTLTLQNFDRWKSRQENRQG